MALLTRLTSGGSAASAAAPGSPKALQRFQNCIAAFLFPSLQQTQPRQCKSTQLDAIDCFTNNLVHKNTKKWEELRDSLAVANTDASAAAPAVSVVVAGGKTSGGAYTTSLTQTIGLMSKGVVSDFQALRSPQLGLDIRSLSQAQLDNLLLSTVEIKNKLDFLYLIRQCIRWERLPSSEVMIACLKYLSTLSRLQQIESLSDICKAQGHPLVKIYAGLAPFKAMALWRSGGADVALQTLLHGYGETSASDEGRRMIRVAFRTIAEETLAQKSEAVLVALMDVAHTIYEQYKDVFIIACVWKHCFASEWFCDQKSATDLLETYVELQQLVARRSNSLCSSFLARNNVDAVHRLIEVYLQYKQRESCSNCLSLLFTYQYLRKDLRACAEIVKSCSELEMPLSEIQNEQFLSLFLNQTGSGESATNSSAPKTRRATTATKEFQYKF